MSAEIVMDADAIARTIGRIALAILEATVDRTPHAGGLGLVGIQRGGLPIAERIAAEMTRSVGRESTPVPVGSVDIGLYRDDAATGTKIGPSDVRFDVGGSDVVLVDDVLQTGRTVRAAIDCLLDYGRPRRIWLAVLCDRGGRELPVAADFVGRVVEVGPGHKLEARVARPGQASADDRVALIAKGGA